LCAITKQYCNSKLSATAICVGDCINFNDLSTGSPTSWSWSFIGANPTSSLAQNPVNICYNNPGSFDVELTVSDGVNNNTLLMPNFITVVALDDASFSYSAASYCANVPDPTPSVTGLAGGTFASSAGIYINAATGTIDLSVSTPGTILRIK